MLLKLFLIYAALLCMKNYESSIYVYAHGNHGNHGKSYSEATTNLVYVNSLFFKYAKNNESMKLAQLKMFLQRFFGSVISELEYNNDTLPNKSNKINCLKLKSNTYLTYASHLNEKIIINVTNFDKLSASLVTNLDSCFNPLITSISKVVSTANFDKIDRNDNETFNGTNDAEEDIDYDEELTFLNLFKGSYWKYIWQKTTKIPQEVWIYTFVSVGIISIVGLICVITIPILNMCCFDYLYQLLTALALGTLTGDALLHLIPNAFSFHDKKIEYYEFIDNTLKTDDNGNDVNIYKGLALIAGIYVFFLIESIMHLISARKSKKVINAPPTFYASDNKSQKSKKKKSSADKIELNGLLASNSHSNVNTVRSNRHRSVYEDDAGLISDYENLKFPTLPPSIRIKNQDSVNAIVYTDDDIGQNKSSRNSNSNKKLRKSDPPPYIFTLNEDEEDEIDMSKQLEPLPRRIKSRKNHKTKQRKLINEDEETPIETPVGDDHTHHGHSHDGHFKASVWMIILGDALHNFSDGVAIGASFASSIPTGIGTTIAVFFHELPHEIGDFAVLRKNNFSIKKAIFFNIISSVLCVLGVLFGLIIGSIDSASKWSFLFIAGTFLYISLVDIIPELKQHKKTADIFIFLLQNLGILLGFGLMTVIALYEDQLVKLIKF